MFKGISLALHRSRGLFLLDAGTESEIWRPLGYSTVGGLMPNEAPRAGGTE